MTKYLKKLKSIWIEVRFLVYLLTFSTHFRSVAHELHFCKLLLPANDVIISERNQRCRTNSQRWITRRNWRLTLLRRTVKCNPLRLTHNWRRWSSGWLRHARDGDSCFNRLRLLLLRRTLLVKSCQWHDYLIAMWREIFLCLSVIIGEREKRRKISRTNELKENCA